MRVRLLSVTKGLVIHLTGMILPARGRYQNSRHLHVPCQLFHETLPFHSDEERVSFAFDVLLKARL